MGGTSASIADSGSVPERMIREIIDADLVIADISMHNPNVYYEIGVRHALRPTGTVLIRARADDQYAHEDVPFDVEGWSYVGYDRRDPGQKLAELVSTIRAFASTRHGRQPGVPPVPGSPSRRKRLGQASP